MTTELTLFDLVTDTVDGERMCGWCNNRPATTLVFAVQNLLGVHNAAYEPTWYRNACHRAQSGPCCDDCAWYVASSWWGGWMACPSGSCHLWTNTLNDPHPGWNCTRHHHESVVVWRDQLAVAA